MRVKRYISPTYHLLFRQLLHRASLQAHLRVFVQQRFPGKLLRAAATLERVLAGVAHFVPLPVAVVAEVALAKRTLVRFFLRVDLKQKRIRLGEKLGVNL